ncbi:MAG: hypothetical protein R3C53_13305 [Pirellulaceae bacterium]
MPETYDGLGISFLYPETWKLYEDEEAGTVSLETPSGSFITITACADLPAALKQAQQAMQAEYEEVEQELIETEIAERTLRGVAQRFVYLDLIVTSRLLGIDVDDNRFLVQIQGEDRELEEQQRVFDAILTSLIQSLSSA